MDTENDPIDPDDDPFGPPEVPTEVFCLHCGKEYESFLIQWRIEETTDGVRRGFWCCPTPGCGGMGFGFDILPTDPEYRDENGGWVWFDDEDEDAEALDYEEETFDEPAQSDAAAYEPGDVELSDYGGDIPF